MNRNACQGRVRPVANRGFTLLEVLVALVLFSLLLMMLYGALFSGARSVRAGDIMARENDDKRLVLSFIRRVTGEVVPMIRRDKQGARLLFRGADASLQFVSRLPAHHAGSGIYFVSLETEDDELLLKYLPLARDKDLFTEDTFVDSEEISLLGDIEAIDLDYFGRDKPDAEAAWHDDWDDKARLPDLIRLTFTLDEPGSWPPLVIAVRAQAVQEQPVLILPAEEDV